MPNYLYNGIELPALPEWDKENYPYAVIGIDGLGRLVVIVSSEPIRYWEWAKGFYYDEGVSALAYVIQDTEFILKPQQDKLVYERPISVFWANHNVVDPDTGVVGLQASEPIPSNANVPYCYYNERKMPALPEWDKTTYPYAIIVYDTDRLTAYSSDRQYLMVSSVPYKLSISLGGTNYLVAPSSEERKLNEFQNHGTYWYDYSFNLTPTHDHDMVVWSNHDIIDTEGLLGEVGSVFFKGSDPVPVPDEPDTPDPEPPDPGEPEEPDEPETVLAWKKHDAYKPNSKSVAYLYNGVELPDINTVWTDKVTYPYAMITRSIHGGICSLDVCGNMPYYTERSYSGESYEPAVVASPPSKHFAIVDGSWELSLEFDSDYSGLSYLTGTFELIWTNVDVINKDDGSVYFNGSDPVIEGGAGWDGNTFYRVMGGKWVKQDESLI